MKFPVIVIGYGNFETNKLFFYEIASLGCLPIFTDAAAATLFCASASERMKELLVDKPPLRTLVCTKQRYLLDMLQMVSMLVPDVQIIELNPSPLTDQYRQKLTTPIEQAKYNIAEFITMLQSDGESNTP